MDKTISTTNCWEFKNCGKQNECPAGKFVAANGFLGGENGGRACVYVTGTFCNKSIQGTYKDKEKKCGECDFYRSLKKDHGAELSVMKFSNYVRNHGKQEIQEFFVLG